MINPGIPQEFYDEQYFLCASEGANEFKASQGTELSSRLEKAVKLAEITPEMTIVDIGCGRGELMYHLAGQKSKIIGFDYSDAAINFCRQVINRLEPDKKERIEFFKKEIGAIELWPESVDRIFLLDVIEHLTNEELGYLYPMAIQALRKGGRIIIRTNPNRWCLAFSTPFLVLINLFRVKKLKKRGVYSEQCHINEQSPRGIKRQLRFAGKCNIMIVMDFQELAARGHFLKFIVSVIKKIPLVRLFLLNDIWVVTTKEK